jgi:hypothetical protein
MNDISSPADSSVRFIRWVFRIAGTLGFFQIAPLYFYESTLNRPDPPAITHPEWYYGFVGVTLAWQIAFLLISRDPRRYRPLLPALFVEKLLFPGAAYALYMEGRLRSPSILASAALDLVWLALFVTAWLRLRDSES